MPALMRFMDSVLVLSAVCLSVQYKQDAEMLLQLAKEHIEEKMQLRQES